MKKGLLAGIILLAIGILLLLKTMGILSFSIWQGFGTYWPVGLILMGIAYMFKQKGLAFVIFVLTLTMGIVYISEGQFIETGEQREIVQEAAFEDIDNLNLDLDFGAGVVNLEGKNGSYLVRNNVQTSGLKDPKFKYQDGTVSISRRSQGFDFLKKIEEKWDLKISSEVLLDIDMDYGAAEMNLDLRNLKVNSLDVDSGASKTEIIFGSYPTKVDIDTGASKLTLKFPEDIGVIIEIDGGAITKHLDGFIVDGTRYKSSNYDITKDNIQVEIDAGATTITGEFY
jgi:hypothetical protein|tara:strand:+ start:1342 stop:2193 length:852 start_codon:yes stop_codon:yes gene_type:complete